MELSDIATLAGKGGLFKILKPTRTGVILESLDEKKTKLVAGTQYRISILEEISIYTTDAEGSKPLKEIFQEQPSICWVMALRLSSRVRPIWVKARPRCSA